MTDEPLDLSQLDGASLDDIRRGKLDHLDFGGMNIVVDARVPEGRVLIGPVDHTSVERLLEGIRNGTVTRGGMAEAGWRDLGVLAEDGLKLKDPTREPGMP